MNTICRMRDGTIISGPSEILDIYESIVADRQNMWQDAKFKEDEVVKIKYDISAIVKVLHPTYHYHDAYMIAKSIAGEVATIISIDKLYDKGILGTYYSVVMKDSSMWYVLPESLIEKAE